MSVLAQTSLFSIVLTLAAYEFALWLRKKWDSPLCNPILISVIVIIVFLLLTGIPNADYQAGCKSFSWLLTPATVCLAVPLYEQLQILKKHILAILAGIIAGTLTSLGCILLLGAAFHLEHTVLISLLPKSITTALGLALSDQLGGIGAITTAAIVVTGILGSVVGVPLCKLLRLHDPVAQGVAFGTASHVIGTTKATELSQLAGAAGSLSLVIAGILTAILCPMLL